MQWSKRHPSPPGARYIHRINGPGTNIYVVTPAVTNQYTGKTVPQYMVCSTNTAIQTIERFAA